MGYLEKREMSHNKRGRRSHNEKVEDASKRILGKRS